MPAQPLEVVIPATVPRAAPWFARLAAQIVTLWPVKMVGTMVWIAAFFWLYFWVMRHPAPGAVPMLMPVTFVDRWFDVHDWAIVPYASLWFYVALAPALARDALELKAYAASAMFLCVSGLAFFWAFPTAVPPFAIDWNHYSALSFLKARDGGTNAFPSLHVAFAVHSAAVIRHGLRGVSAPAWLHALNVAWSTVVVYSVFATRQHVFVDVVGGLVVVVPSLWIGWHTLRAAQRRPDAAGRAP
jgi:hypothetical protein